MNMIKNDYIVAKSFIAKNVFILSILLIIIVFVKIFKII